MKYAIRVAGLSLVLAQSPIPTHAASFNCMDAVSVVELLICSDESLSKLDEDLADAYLALREQSHSPKVLIREQRQWIAKRNTCRDRSCIKQAYEKRLPELQGRLPEQDLVTCDSSKGAVDLDRCPAAKRQLERDQLALRESCAGIPGVNPEFFCLEEQLERMEKRVARVYREAIRVVENPALLKQGQDAWRAIRAGDCEVQITHVVNQRRCQIASTVERLEQLQIILRGDCKDYRDFCVPIKK